MSFRRDLTVIETDLIDSLDHYITCSLTGKKCLRNSHNNVKKDFQKESLLAHMGQ